MSQTDLCVVYYLTGDSDALEIEASQPSLENMVG